MVSRIIKKTPNKIYQRLPEPSPEEVAPQEQCRRRLFSCHCVHKQIDLHLPSTPYQNLLQTNPNQQHPNRRKGYQILKNKAEEDASDGPRKTLVFGNHLPPLELPEKRTIFLDLDETLVHSSRRPGVDELLEKLGEKFEIVVFTAGLREYASLVLDRLDKKGMISHRLYRDSCKEIDGKFVKDLSDLGRDLKRVVIVDDNPNAYFLQPENAIPMPPFIDDLADGELENLIEFFEGCDSFKDMRDAVKHYQAKGSYKQSDI
ncbi:CTD small phosphatase-like protein [Vitis vinifera]|uniref:CTD small phosphatase-like protein n=1 Tax=Vitis vinifera TaxID=29760 RepID=A0A438HH45_VITVI|nr:CTD small phosphatase-like protein [Vitis vinifera]